MIFVTVGTQLPFDRLIAAVDAWAARSGRTDVVAQIGPSKHRPAHMEHHRLLDPDDYKRLQDEAELVVGHCGIGSIVSRLELGKPVLVMPRRHDLGEHRNDHQVDTARRLQGISGLRIAFNETELTAMLDQFAGEEHSAAAIPAKAPAEFTDKLAKFISEGAR